MTGDITTAGTQILTDQRVTGDITKQTGITRRYSTAVPGQRVTGDITTAGTQILTDQRVTGDITTAGTQILTDQRVTGDITTVSTQILTDQRVYRRYYYSKYTDTD